MCVLPQERPAWHAAELAAAMGLTQEALRRRVLFWIGQGVLQETATQGGAVGPLMSTFVTHVLSLIQHYHCQLCSASAWHSSTQQHCAGINCSESDEGGLSQG